MALIIGAWFVLQGISKNSKFAGVRSAVEVGFDYRCLGCLYYRIFLKVLNLRVLAPPSRLALNLGAWSILHGISKSCDGAAVEVAFDYWGLVCITGDF